MAKHGHSRSPATCFLDNNTVHQCAGRNLLRYGTRLQLFCHKFLVGRTTDSERYISHRGRRAQSELVRLLCLEPTTECRGSRLPTALLLLAGIWHDCSGLFVVSGLALIVLRYRRNVLPGKRKRYFCTWALRSGRTHFSGQFPNGRRRALSSLSFPLAVNCPPLTHNTTTSLTPAQPLPGDRMHTVGVRSALRVLWYGLGQENSPFPDQIVFRIHCSPLTRQKIYAEFDVPSSPRYC